MGWFDGGAVDPDEYAEALKDSARKSGKAVSSSDTAKAKAEAKKYNAQRKANNN